MNVQQAYDAWAVSYDSMPNPTRDLEARALQQTVPPGPHGHVVELGCGTGKNTAWLAAQARQLTAVDFSAEMLAQAQAKRLAPQVRFQQADITQPWHWLPAPADVLSCSLILEHIRDLSVVFAHARAALRPGGLFYIGELHPFKQYRGTQARFDLPNGTRQELECYVHHLSDFTETARQHGFLCQRLQEWFDEDDRTSTPRIVSFLFKREG